MQQLANIQPVKVAYFKNMLFKIALISQMKIL